MPCAKNQALARQIHEQIRHVALASGTPETKHMRLAILISGAGSTLAAVLAAIARGELAHEIVLVASDRADAQGLTIARAAGVPVQCIGRAAFAKKAAFEAALASALNAARPDLILLAGFMRVLSAEFVALFAGKMLNLHPSLLPKFPGLDTCARALAAGETEHGASLHWVTAELDGGPIIAQTRTAIHALDTPASLQARLKPLEHALVISQLRRLGSWASNTPAG
jgi:phosphoribosylglycinamide formyltransferase 1